MVLRNDDFLCCKLLSMCIRGGQVWGPDTLRPRWTTDDQIHRSQQKSDNEIIASHSQHEFLLEDEKKLGNSLDESIALYNQQMAHSMAPLKLIGDDCCRLPEKQPLSSPLLRQLLFTLRPLPMEVINDETTHQDTPRHFFRTDTTADFSIFSSSANALLRYLHSDKNPNTENPDVKTTAHLVPLLGQITGVLVISMMTNAAGLLSSLQ